MGRRREQDEGCAACATSPRTNDGQGDEDYVEEDARDPASGSAGKRSVAELRDRLEAAGHRRGQALCRLHEKPAGSA
ncbi:hypothetical protein MTBLM5_70102 [Magnetospirillum sp. LM-5]|nr:hypothetical protein MTBLM5_70102 [Magnetospirillum sp. LM-5]